jgi:CDP-diacylglycerol--serine O-phosphatidyltransferase
MAAFSALRLAKFNLDERQTDKFIGLPTPANAMVWASLPFIMTYSADGYIAQHIIVPQILIPLSLVMSYLLICELPLFSLKFKTWDFASNKIRYIFLLLSLILIIVLRFASIPAIILLYVLMSVIAFKPEQH